MSDPLCRNCRRHGPKGVEEAVELPRIPIPRTWLNRSKKEGRRLLCSEGQHVHPKRCVTQVKAPPERGLLGEQENLPSCTDCWAHSCRRGCPRSCCPSQTYPRRCLACYGRSGCRLRSCSWASALLCGTDSPRPRPRQRYGWAQRGRCPRGGWP